MHVVLRLRAEDRPATQAERDVLLAWTGWGAAPYLFDERKRFAPIFAAERAELQRLLSEDEYAKARSSTLNAHYTDPGYTRIVWQALSRLGAQAGTSLRVLEPGAGAGRFLADAPPDAEVVGVEVDPITAAVAQALHPHAQIVTESFAETRPPEEDFDLVVGNVPFGKHKVRDKQYNPGRRHSIHNHFILKSLEFTRPGGIVALITSRYTLDGTDEAHREARERMAALGDLLGAVRLPSKAHQDAAGTHVVTDLLVFRRRAEGEPSAEVDWMDVEPVLLPGSRAGVAAQPVEVNGYFLRHPEMVLGTPKVDVARYGADLVVQAETPVEQALSAALDQVVEHAQASGRTLTPRMVFHSSLEKYDGLLEVRPDGTFTEIRNGRPLPHVPPQTQARELRELIGLRDIAVALLDEESENQLTTPRMVQLRAELNRRYDAYTTRFGAINRFKVNARPAAADGAEGDEAAERRTYPRMGGFRNDPFAPYVLALESFNEDTGEASKADLFAKRVVAPPERLTRADSPEDAALICWDQHNEIRLDVVAGLLGLDSESQAREALGTLVYDDPAPLPAPLSPSSATGSLRAMGKLTPSRASLVRRMEYLSGNVRRKLVEAEKAAEKNEKFAPNVTALREVIPRDLQPAEIESRLGAAWVNAKYVQQFLREILEDDDIEVSNLGARWSVKGGDTGSLLARTVWGTKARSAQALASNLLNNQEIRVTRTLPDKQVVEDKQVTAFALAKSRQLDDRFRMWLWEDPDRAEVLLRYYNDRYNAIVPPNYEGTQIAAPGLSKAYDLHPHQMAAVARIRATKTGVGLYHGTGAGKTLEMIVGGMELTRLGLAKKPVYAVPKGVLGQFQREFLQAYPRARILVADSSDLTGERRHQFVARWSTGNWDAVIISHTAFKKIPMSKAARLDYINQEVKRLEAHLENAEGGDRYTVKDIENQIATLKGRIEDEIETPGDSGVEFERTGSTYIFYDEAHTLKNLRVISSINDLALEGNQITADMDMKLSYLRKNYGGRVVTQATATPVDNSPMEILTAIKYLAPDMLRDEWGIEEDDQFVSTFIQPVNRVEMSPDGNSFSTRARYARYVNQTELKRVLFSFADVKLKRDLQLGEPSIIGGEMRILEAEASPELREVMKTLGQRMMGIRHGSPEMKFNRKGKLVEDNTLWISTDGRLASLDVRLVNKFTDHAQKVDVAADELFRLWKLHKDTVYYDEDGNEETVRGSLQLAFCDLGVPGPDKEFVFYQALREALTARGMPGSLIRFDQEAKNPRQKAQLDKDAREGRVAVLVGSRSGLGTGRNLQKRVIHVMQIDPTWKATPIIQSLGRGKRQGNQNKEIHHTAIVTKKSYDPFLWQKVATKQAFAEAILDVNDTSRILEAAEDGDDGRIPAGVMFAVAADKPELEQLERIEGLLAKLRLEQRMWHDEQFAYKITGEQGRRRVQDLTARMQDAKTAMERRTDTRGEAFAMTVDGRAYDERREAGEALAGRLDRLARSSVGTGMQKDAVVGQLGGFPVFAVTQRNFEGMFVEMHFQGAPVELVRLAASGLANQDRVGLIRRLENALDTLESIHDKSEKHIARIEANMVRAQELVGKPFPQQTELDTIEAEHRKLQKALGVQGAAEETKPEAHDPEVPEPDFVDPLAEPGPAPRSAPAGAREAAPAAPERPRSGPPAQSRPGSESPAADISDVIVAPYPDAAAATAGEDRVLAVFEAWQDLDVVERIGGREQARLMEEAGLAVVSESRHQRATASEDGPLDGDPWAVDLFRELAGRTESFLSYLDSSAVVLNDAGRAMRDLTERVSRAAREHITRAAPMEGRRRAAPPAPATVRGPVARQSAAAVPAAEAAVGPFEPDRWYQHTMLGGSMSDSRGDFLNDIVAQLSTGPDDVSVEPDGTGAVLFTGPRGTVRVTPLAEELPASVAQGFEAAITEVLQNALRYLPRWGSQAGEKFDDWLTEELKGTSRITLERAVASDDKDVFRQAMRVRFYAAAPWAHPDTAHHAQPDAPVDQTDQRTAGQEVPSPPPTPDSGGEMPDADVARNDASEDIELGDDGSFDDDADPELSELIAHDMAAMTALGWTPLVPPFASQQEANTSRREVEAAYERWAASRTALPLLVDEREALADEEPNLTNAAGYVAYWHHRSRVAAATAGPTGGRMVAEQFQRLADAAHSVDADLTQRGAYVADADQGLLVDLAHRAEQYAQRLAATLDVLDQRRAREAQHAHPEAEAERRMHEVRALESALQYLVDRGDDYLMHRRGTAYTEPESAGARLREDLLQGFREFAELPSAEQHIDANTRLLYAHVLGIPLYVGWRDIGGPVAQAVLGFDELPLLEHDSFTAVDLETMTSTELIERIAGRLALDALGAIRDRELVAIQDLLAAEVDQQPEPPTGSIEITAGQQQPAPPREADPGRGAAASGKTPAIPAAEPLPGGAAAPPYVDRAEYWAGEQSALESYRRWAADNARRLGSGDQERALLLASEVMVTDTREARTARLLGLEFALDWRTVQQFADGARAVVEKWEREEGRNIPGNWEMFTTLRDHAARYRSTVEDRLSDAYRHWAHSQEPITLDDEEAVEFIPGILPWDEYTVRGPHGLQAGPVRGSDLAAGLAQLAADGTEMEEADGGLVLSASDNSYFSIRLAPSPSVATEPSAIVPGEQAANPATAAGEDEAQPDEQTAPAAPASSGAPPQAVPSGAERDAFGSVLSQAANLAILLEGYADGAELVAGRSLVASAAQRLRQAVARQTQGQDGDERSQAAAGYDEAAAAVAAIQESEQLTPVDVFTLYDHLAVSAARLADSSDSEMSAAAQRVVRYTERHLARMQALRDDLAGVLLDASNTDEDSDTVLNHGDPLRLTAPWYNDLSELSDALYFIHNSFQKWPHAYDDQGGEYSDQLRGAMLLLHRPHDTVGSALTDWMQVASYALGAAEEAGDGVSRYALRDLARRAFQHHQRLAAHQLGREDTRPYESGRDFVGGANRAESAWNLWLVTDTAKELLDRSPSELREAKLSSAREALDGARDARYAADWASADDDNLDEVNRHATTMAHAAYDLVLSLEKNDYRDPDDAKVLSELVRQSYEHAAGCRASAGRPETVAAVRAGVAERQEQLAAEREPEAAAPTAAEAQPTSPSANAALEIEHHFRGTVVRGTSKDDADAPVRDALHRHKFKWSRNQGFWYLRRNMVKATRDVHVRNLTDELARLGRPYRMVEEPQQDSAPQIVIPVGEPYASKEEAEHDFQDMFGGLWRLRDTPAGNRLVTRGLTNQGVPARPDGQAVWMAMEELRGGAVGSSLDPFAHPAKDVVERCTKLALATMTLAHNLAEERYRAPVAMRHFATMNQYATQLASRITATAQGSRWGEIFGTPGLEEQRVPAELPEPVRPELAPAPSADATLQPPAGPTADEDQQGPASGREEDDLLGGPNQRRIEITLAARSAQGHLLVNVGIPADRAGLARDVADLRAADVPGLTLPAYAALPILVRPAALADTLVSDEEVDSWLSEHLPNSPVAAGWNVLAVRAEINRAARDLLRDSMAPASEDVAAWLVNAASENQNLIEAAHVNQQDNFLLVFARAADDLITDGGSEHLHWTYLGSQEARREILDMAGPRAYQELRQRSLEPAPPETVPLGPAQDEQPGPEQVSEAERERKQAEFQAENDRRSAEHREQARERAVRAALADDLLRSLLMDGRPREDAQRLFADWLSGTDLSANGEGDLFRDWFRYASPGAERQQAELVFEQVYSTLSAAAAGEPSADSETNQVDAAASTSAEPSVTAEAPKSAPQALSASADADSTTDVAAAGSADPAPAGTVTGPHLTEEHLRSLPHHPQRWHGEDARLAVVATLAFEDGQVRDALLLLQSVELDPRFSDEPIVRGAQIVPANDLVSSSTNGRWLPEHLLAMADSRVLLLSAPIPWPEVEALTALPPAQALLALPLAPHPARRFSGTGQLVTHFKAAPIPHLAGNKQAREELRRLAERESFALTPNGMFALFQEADGTWALRAAGSGLEAGRVDEYAYLLDTRLETALDVMGGLRSQEEAMAFSDRLAAVRDHLGAPIDWTDPNLPQALGAFRFELDRLVLRERAAFDRERGLKDMSNACLVWDLMALQPERRPAPEGQEFVDQMEVGDRVWFGADDEYVPRQVLSVRDDGPAGLVTVKLATLGVSDEDGLLTVDADGAYVWDAPRNLLLARATDEEIQEGAGLRVSLAPAPEAGPASRGEISEADTAKRDAAALLGTHISDVLLTPQHIQALPRYKGRPPHDADAQLAVVATLSSPNGSIRDAVLLLQATEADPQFGDILHCAVIVPDSDLDLSSRTGLTRFPRELLHNADARVLPLAEPLPWNQIEELVRLPYAEAVARLPLATEPEPSTSAPEPVPQEAVGQTEADAAPLAELIDGFGDRVIVGHIGPSNGGAGKAAAPVPDVQPVPAAPESEEEATGATATVDQAEQPRTMEDDLGLLPGETFLGYLGRFDGDYDVSVPGGRYVFRTPGFTRKRYSVRFMPDLARGWESQQIASTDDPAKIMPLVRKHARKLAEIAAYEEAELRATAATEQQSATRSNEQQVTHVPPQSPEPADEPQQKEESVTATEPETAEGPWTSRIKIVSDVTGTYVTGTTGGPQEDSLRDLLKRDRNFKYDSGRWRYNGMLGQRDQILGDVRAFLAAKDAQENAVETVASGKFPPTAQQQAIIDACLEGKTVVVQALAGTGKTSTLQMVAERMPERRIAYVAFNRAIADEAGQKFGRNVTAKTSHSFALQDLRNTPYRKKVSIAGPRNSGARRPRDVAAALGITTEMRIGERDGNIQYIGPEEVAKLVMGAVRRYRQSADAELGRQHLGEKWSHTSAARKLLEYARRAWADIADPNSNKIVFDHDDYLKLWALSNPRLNFEVIFFDEAQDINPVLKKVIQDQPAQTIVVGDSNQAIYEFRGAIDALRDWPADVVLPLTQSWRFGPAVAAVGNQYLALLESDLRLEGAPALDTTLGTVDEPDAILTRTNVGAISAVFAGFEAGKRVALVGGGRDIEDIAKAARDLQQGRRTKHPELSAFEDWNEVKEYAESDEDARTLQMFVRLVDRYTPQGLINMIRDLVPEEARDEETRPQLIVSTAHKSKGREWDLVQIWGDFPQPNEDTKTGELLLPNEGELRLAYVTVTRAKKRLDIGSLGWIHSIGHLADTPQPEVAVAQAPAKATREEVAPGLVTDAAVSAEPAPTPAPAAVPAGAEKEPVPAQQPGLAASSEASPSSTPAETALPAATGGTAHAEAETAHVAKDMRQGTAQPGGPAPGDQPEKADPTLQDAGEPLPGADKPALFGQQETPAADQAATAPPASQEPGADIAPLPWDDEKIKKRGAAGIRRDQKNEIPNLAREMREAIGDNQVRDVWEQDHPYAQFEENLQHTLDGLAETDPVLHAVVTEASARLRDGIEQIAAQARGHFENLIQPRAHDPAQLAELDDQLAQDNRLPELTNPLVRQALILVLDAVDEIERTARSRKLKPAAARDALEQVIGLAGTSYSPDGQQLWPNVDAALAPIKVELDRARERMAELANSTVTEQYARLRALIAAHEAQPTVTPTADDTPALEPPASQDNSAEPPTPSDQTPEPDTLSDRDIAMVLNRISAFDFGQLIFEMDQKKRKTPQLYDGFFRLPSEPGYNEEGTETGSAYSTSGGIEIEIKTDAGSTMVRAGKLTLAKALAWIRPALPPERRELLSSTWRTRNAMSRTEQGFQIIGESGRWRAAHDELWRLLQGAKDTVIKESLEAHLTGQADERIAQIRAAEKWAQEDQHPQLFDVAGAQETFAEIASLERVAALRAVLPDTWTGVRRLGEIKPGDCFTMVSEAELPFIVREPAVVTGGEVSIAGDLVFGPGDLRPYVWEPDVGPDEVVEPLLLPRSLAGLIDLPEDEPRQARVAPEATAPSPATLTHEADDEPTRAAEPAGGQTPSGEPTAPAVTEAADPAPPAQDTSPEPATDSQPGHLPYERLVDLLADLHAAERAYEAWAASATGQSLLAEARELQEETGLADSNEAARVQTAFYGAVLAANSTRSRANLLLGACRHLYSTVAEAGSSLATRGAFASDEDRQLLLSVYSRAQEQLARLEATEDVQQLLDSEHDAAWLLTRYKEDRLSEQPGVGETPEAEAEPELVVAVVELPGVDEPPVPEAEPVAATAVPEAEAEPELVVEVVELPGVDEPPVPEIGPVAATAASEPAPAAAPEPAAASTPDVQPVDDVDEVDFFTDMVGGDLAIGGVVHSSAEWGADEDDEVRRRHEEPDEPVSAEELAGLELEQEHQTLIKEERMAAAEAATGEPGAPEQDDFDRHFEDIVAMMKEAPAAERGEQPAQRPPLNAEAERLLREQHAMLRRLLSEILTGNDADPILPAAEDPAVEAGDAAALDAAMGNAQSEAGYYWGTPEWTMIRSISQAGQELRGAVREVVLVYAESTLRDIRSYGINRTIEARTARAISRAALFLARRLERSGQRDSRGWRAVWGLHRAAATRADRLTGLLPAGQRIDLAEQLRGAWQWFTEQVTSRFQSRQDTAGGEAAQEPGRLRTIITNSGEAINWLYGAVAERIGNLAEHPVWRRIVSVWSAVRAAADKGWLGFGRLMADRQTLGTGRMLWVRTLEIISHGAQALIDRLSANGGRDGLRWNLLRTLRHAAEDHIAQAHGHLPEGANTPLGTYESAPAVGQEDQQTPTTGQETATPDASAAQEGSALQDGEQPLGEKAVAGDPDRFRQVVVDVATKLFTLDMDLSYNHGVSMTEAKAMLERMEELGVVGPQREGGVRDVLVAPAEAESILDAPPAAQEPGPRWQPVNEPLRTRWFDEAKAALPREAQPDGALTRSDMISLLSKENTRVARRLTPRADAGRRANESVELFLQGRGDEVPQHLAGEGFVYARGAGGTGWDLQEAPAPAAPPEPSGPSAEAAPMAEREGAAGPELPRRRRAVEPGGESKIAQAAVGRRPAPAAAPDRTAITQKAFAAQARRMQDRADFAQASATSPAEERAAGILRKIAANSQATVDRLSGGVPAGRQPASTNAALTAEAFIAALQTTAHARGAQIPDDLLASAMAAAREAAAAAPKRAPLPAGSASGPTRKGRAEEQQAEQRLHGQQGAPSGVRRR